jgi:murein DD-endopeptidase MepM/ murein hydrolase activator NlpD
MAKKAGKFSGFISHLKNKFRLVIMNDSTFEEKLSFRLSRLNVFVVSGTIIILLIVITTFIIAFTPLREYIPGYGDFKTKHRLDDLTLKADSLEKALIDKDLYLYNIKNIIEGKEIVEKLPDKPDSTRNYGNIKNSKSKEDSNLRQEIESQNQYNLSFSEEGTSPTNYSISSFFFFCPIKGIVTNGFNTSEKHYGVDIVAAKDEAIKATLDGTVIFTSWTLETGYVIAIQHNSDMISIYKHNSGLLKKQGSSVRAGEAIAIIGSSGEQSSGPHLHFELWYNGRAVNPRDYIVF